MSPLVLLLALALSHLVAGESEPQMEVILFNQADTDDDGELTEADLDHIFFMFDLDSNGNVSRAEFQDNWTNQYNLGSPVEATDLFDRADTDHDGDITQSDLSAIFTFFDMDGDNLVSLNEFLTQWGDLRLEIPDVVNIHIDP